MKWNDEPQRIFCGVGEGGGAQIETNISGIYPEKIPTLEEVIVPVDVDALIEELEQKTNQNNN